MRFFIDTEFHEFSKRQMFLGMPIGKPINTIEIISIGIVADNGNNLYLVSKDFDIDAAWSNEWLKDNVLKKIHLELWNQISSDEKYFNTYFHQWTGYFSKKSIKALIDRFGKSIQEISKLIVDFTESNQNKKQNVFIGYYSDYDWVVFCWLFGRMIDLPKNFPMYCYDLKQSLDDLAFKYAPDKPINETLQCFKNHPKYPKQINEHNALDDAYWNRELLSFIGEIEIEIYNKS